MNPRNGKISRLPHEIREELNLRLECSEPGPKILLWLNGLKEVKALLQEEFDGEPINKQNLSQWRLHGFQEWLVRQQLWDQAREVEGLAGRLEGERDKVLADRVATVLAARYAALLGTWDGEPGAKIEAQVRILNNLSRPIVQLQRMAQQSAKDYRAYVKELEEEGEAVRQKCKQMLLNQVFSIRREPHLAEYFGGGPVGEKLAKYVIQLQNDVPGAELEALTEEDIKQSQKSAK